MTLLFVSLTCGLFLAGGIIRFIDALAAKNNTLITVNGTLAIICLGLCLQHSWCGAKNDALKFSGFDNS
jgi:hypothetical protein